MLNRGIRRWDLVLLVINSIIGAGIFGLPSKIFALSGVYSLLAFAVCAIVVLIFVACFAEVSAQFDRTGGPYVYALESMGRPVAYFTGWLLQLSRWFNYATLINLQVIYLSFFIPIVKEPLYRALVIVLVTGFLAVMNYRGIKDSTRLTNIFTAVKLLVLCTFIIVGLFHLQPELFTAPQMPAFPAFSTSVLLLVFAFGGFESALINSGEIVNPKRNLPFALVMGIAAVTIVYCLVQVVCIGTLPGLASTEKPMGDAASLFMGNSGAGLIAGGAVVSIFGTLNALMLSGSRLPFALSMEGQFPKIFSQVHARYQTPTNALILFFVVAVILSIAWSFLTALAIGAIIRVLVYMTVCIALLRLRVKKRGEEIPFKLRYGPVFAVLGILLSIWLLSSTKLNEIRDVGIAVAIGGIVYMTINSARLKNPKK